MQVVALGSDNKDGERDLHLTNEGTVSFPSQLHWLPWSLRVLFLKPLAHYGCLCGAFFSIAHGENSQPVWFNSGRTLSLSLQ